MGLIVQKFGGSSLTDADRMRRCAARAVAAHLDGHQVVVVTSAMGKTTDELLGLARRITTAPPQRELDLLLVTGEQVSAALMAMAIHELGVEAVSLPAHGLGIITSLEHCNAKIHRIEAHRLRRLLDGSRIVVATGFQGLTADGQVTTLGRGGSDTTAVAIAAALGIKQGTGVCEIYTDVDGVYTADPRLVPNARRLKRLSYEEMVELAALGAGVLHGRAVMFGQRYQVPIHVRHSARDEEGTMILRETPEMERVCVVGCALTADLGRLTVRGLPNTPGTESIIFQSVADAGIVVDDIIQIENGDAADVSFTVEAPRLADLKIAVQEALATIGRGEMSIEVGLAKVSAVGVGMRTHTGVAATIFRALGEAGINIANITTSEIKISCIVPREDGRRALRIVHDAFNLGGAGQPPARDAAARPSCLAAAGAGDP